MKTLRAPVSGLRCGQGDATRGDCEEFARVADEHGLAATASLPALATWRREVLGQAWERWISGGLAIVGDAKSPHGLRLVET